ncbi:hypothetical protein APR41_14570 [Salegentibacter salinarum]|uniref:Uncharacterized protein n=1 Tax=Salegentibacter salinarum TaxID=447422 RepID=A0A2N0TZM5_9FLAO|nr:hypothetical protein [Salegentibacter salinarum]PKD20203.1 hypothetical protein APR41_14570 [Salegentibacter salinarum]SKB87140.1 hypothetical protein SAMN05660903_02966 [Salegentibacter salinarum]
MKILKLVVFALAISAGSLLHAAPGNSPETSASFKKEIHDLLKNIELDIEEEVVANLVVSFNENNEMQVLYVGTTHTPAGKLIKQHLNHKKIKTVLDPSIKKYKLPIRLKP